MIDQLVVSLLFFVIFVSGILFDRYILGNYHQNIKYQDFFSKQKNHSRDIEKSSQITIDDKKVVLGVNTDNMIKQHNDLGVTTKQKDTTQSAINKLKSMKG